ncbi:MAG TPA: DedA family protein [Propionibacteriaceae bacterium]|nr:DedA family protein [Propionibacteriaceae bacterium]
MDHIVRIALHSTDVVWGYLALFLLIVADGILPIVPSETTATTFAAIVRFRHPEFFPYLVLATWSGAWVGDHLAYFLGSRKWLHEWLHKGRRTSKLLHWAHEAFRKRGVVLLIVGRFLPGVRVAINFTAGVAGVRWPRFALLTMVTSGVWTAYILGSGWVAGHWLRYHPVIALVGAALVSAAIGFLVDRIARLIVLRRRGDDEADLTLPED